MVGVLKAVVVKARAAATKVAMKLMRLAMKITWRGSMREKGEVG